MARPKLPVTVTVGGVRRHVVARNTKVWTEQEASGRLRHHVGTLLTDGQLPSKVLDKPKPCTRCKQPSWAATARGRARHDACEGWTSMLPDEEFINLVCHIAADLGAALTTPGDSSATTEEVRHAA